ncbi:MAG: hypothetical protein OWS03_01690 [Alicyclobacillaceae bacterium]|nr:hypothetical protein [Alicyclobacillaceae bacterium]
MKRDQLIKGLSVIARVVPDRSTKPVLTCALFEVQSGGGITITGQDVNVAMRWETTLTSEESPNHAREVLPETAAAEDNLAERFVAPIKRIRDFLAHCDGTTVSFETVDSHVLFRSGTSECRFATLDAREFPRLPSPALKEPIEISKASFLDALRNAPSLWERGKPTSSGAHAGVWVAVRGDRIALRNAHSNATMFVQYEETLDQECAESFAATLHQESARELLSVLSEIPAQKLSVRTAKSSTKFHVECGEYQFWGSLASGKFPDMDTFFQPASCREYTVSPSQFVAISARMAAVAPDGENHHTVHLVAAENGFEIRTTSEYGAFSEVFHADPPPPAGLSLSLNYRLFLEACKHMDDEEVCLLVESPLKPLAIADARKTFVVAPLISRS